MSFWQYERILNAQNAWHEARTALPPIKDDAEQPNKPKPLPIRTDGTGPQMANRPGLARQ